MPFVDKYASQFGAGSQYSYYHEEDESTFQLVDTGKVQKTQYQRSRMRYNLQRLRRERQKNQAAQPQMQVCDVPSFLWQYRKHELCF